MIDMVATGVNIRHRMKEKKITVKKLEDIMGFNTPQAIYKWLKGKSLPSIDNLVILAEVLDCAIDDILRME